MRSSPGAAGVILDGRRVTPFTARLEEWGFGKATSEEGGEGLGFHPRQRLHLRSEPTE